MIICIAFMYNFTKYYLTFNALIAIIRKTVIKI